MKKEKSMKLLLKGMVFFFIGTIFTKIFAYVYRAIIARGFSVEEYGVFSLALTVFGIATVIATLGISQGVERFLGYFTAEPQKIKGIIKSAFKIALPASIAMAILIIVLSKTIAIHLFHEQALTPLLIVIAVGLPFFIITDINTAIFRGVKNVKYQMYIKDILENVLKITITGAAIFLGAQIIGAIYAYVIALIIASVAGYRLVKKKIIPKVEKIPKMDKELFSFSWPIMFTGLFYTATKWTDTFMLGILDTKTSVGLYNAALPIAGLLTIVYAAFGSLIIPVLAEMHKNKEYNMLKEVFLRLNKWIFIITLPLFVITLLFPEQLLTLLFGFKYIQAASALRWLALGFFFGVMAGHVGALMNILGKTKPRMLIWISGGVLGIILNYFFIKAFSLEGAALATAITFFYLNIASMIYIKKEVHFTTFTKKYFKPAIAMIIPILTVLGIQAMTGRFNLWGFIIASIGLTILYAFLTIIFKSLDKEDTQLVELVEKKTGMNLHSLRKFLKKHSNESS